MRRIVRLATLLATVSPLAFAPGAFADPAPPPAQQQRDVVVVTASPLDSDPETFATIVESVRRDDILEKGGANLADALKDVPGVSGTGFAAGASRPVIRGMDANRVKLLEDGVSSSDVSDIGPDHGVPIDPLSAQSIEVVRGAATLRYGNQAIGGVVNAINNRVPLVLSPDAMSGEATASYASGADTGQGSAMLDGTLGQFAWHVDAFGRRSSDYAIPHGVMDNSFFRGDGFSAGTSYFFSDNNDSRVGLAGIHYDAKYGIPGEDTYIDMKQTKGISKSSFAVNAGPLQTINVDLGYADYKHSEKEPDGTVDSTFLNTEWDGRVEALFGPTGFLSGSALGVQATDRKFSALGEGADYLSPTETTGVAAFAFAEAPVGDSIHLQGAVRVESTKLTGTPLSDIPTERTFKPVSASLGGLLDVGDDLKLGLTLASAGRAPAVTELFARGPHDGPGTFEFGNPDLRIERSTSLEGTARWKLAPVKIEASLWGSRFDNFIYGELTGRTCDDNGVCAADDTGELKELLYQQRNADFYGAEIKASADLFQTPAGTLQVHGLADKVRAKFASGGGNVPRIQPWRAGGGLDWSGDRIDAGFTLIYVGRQDDISTAETPTKGFVALDAQIAWHLTENARGLTLILAGHNLTDDEQHNSVAINKDEVTLPGRDISLILRQTF